MVPLIMERDPRRNQGSLSYFSSAKLSGPFYCSGRQWFLIPDSRHLCISAELVFGLFRFSLRFDQVVFLLPSNEEYGKIQPPEDRIFGQQVSLGIRN